MHDNLQISPLRATEIDRLIALTRDTWMRHYTNIITVAQIEYMLEQRYHPLVIREQLRRPDLWWDVLKRDDELLAFAQYEWGTTPGHMKLDKLYVRYDLRGSGLGTLLLQHVENEARAKGATRLYLQVNKNNESAIGAYRKNGFEVVESAVFDIGGGFVMDDHVMAKPLTPLSTGATAP